MHMCDGSYFQTGLFRQTFGTHYVESAIFGGELQFVLVMNSELYTKMTYSQMMEQTSIGQQKKAPFTKMIYSQMMDQ